MFFKLAMMFFLSFSLVFNNAYAISDELATKLAKCSATAGTLLGGLRATNADAKEIDSVRTVGKILFDALAEQVGRDTAIDMLTKQTNIILKNNDPDGVVRDWKDCVKFMKNK